MELKFKTEYLIGMFIAIVLAILDYWYYWNTRWFYALLVVAISIGWLQFWYDFFKELNRQKELEVKFLEFVRSLVGSVKSGIPIPKAILQVADDDYGALTPYVKKLSNQIGWGIPVQEALVNFSNSTYNDVIKRSISIVIEAERSGGDIGNVLESISTSVVNVKKIKEERKAGVYSQIVQGYIVFFIFIAIMLVLQLKLLPQLTGLSGSFSLGGLDLFGGIIGMGEQVNLDRIFFSLILIQGFFAGIMVGKFSEGTLKQGLLHSLILMTSATLIITTVKGGI